MKTKFSIIEKLKCDYCGEDIDICDKCGEELVMELGCKFHGSCDNFKHLCHTCTEELGEPSQQDDKGGKSE